MEQIFEFLKDYLGEAVVAIISATIAYLTGRKKAHVELRHSEGEALKTMQDAYDKFTADSLKKYEELYSELHQVKEMLKLVKDELEDCRNGILRRS